MFRCINVFEYGIDLFLMAAGTVQAEGQALSYFFGGIGLSVQQESRASPEVEV